MWFTCLNIIWKLTQPLLFLAPMNELYRVEDFIWYVAFAWHWCTILLICITNYTNSVDTFLCLFSTDDHVLTLNKMIGKCGLKFRARAMEVLLPVGDAALTSNKYGSVILCKEDTGLSVCVYKGFSFPVIISSCYSFFWILTTQSKLQRYSILFQTCMASRSLSAAPWQTSKYFLNR